MESPGAEATTRSPAPGTTAHLGTPWGVGRVGALRWATGSLLAAAPPHQGSPRGAVPEWWENTALRPTAMGLQAQPRAASGGGALRPAPWLLAWPLWSALQPRGASSPRLHHLPLAGLPAHSAEACKPTPCLNPSGRQAESGFFFPGQTRTDKGTCVHRTSPSPSRP